MVPFESFVLVSYWLFLVTKALSLAVCAHRTSSQTDRQTDRIRIAYGDLMLRIISHATDAGVKVTLASILCIGLRPLRHRYDAYIGLISF